MAEPRWLTEDESRTWRSFVLTSMLLQVHLERGLKRSADLSFAHYNLLARLSEAPCRSMRMSELATDAVLDRSTLCRMIDRLARNGWVRRVRCETDHRGQLAELTDEGMTVVERAAPAHVEHVRALVIDRLTPEQHRALREISALLAPDSTDPANPASAGRFADS